MSDGLDRIKLWSIGGGKGGIGKSFITLGLGMSLARWGKKVILIDGDLGGANLHTLMGIRYPHVTLEHFLLKKVARLEDIVIETQIKGIGLICGADDILGSANPTYAQKIRLLNQIEELPAQYVLLDLGAGTSFNLLDFFNYSGGKIALFTSQATSLQNAYGFIKSALYRKLTREFSKDEEMLNFLFQTGINSRQTNTQSLGELMSYIKEKDPEKYLQMGQLLGDFRLFLIVNLVKSHADLRSPEIIKSVCHDFLNIQPEILGHVVYDPAVEAAISQMMPFPLDQKRSKVTMGLEEIALKMVKESRLPKSSWGSSREAVDEVELSMEKLVTQPS